MAGPSAAIWTTALFVDAVSPTIVVSTKLKRGSLSHMRIVVAVKIISCLYEGKRPPSPSSVASVLLSEAVSLLEGIAESEPSSLVVLFVEEGDPSVSSEVVYKGGNNVDLDMDDVVLDGVLDVVLDLDILSDRHVVEELHLTTDNNGEDLCVDKGDATHDVCD